MSTATKTEEEKKTAEAEDTRSKYHKEGDEHIAAYDKKLTEQADTQKAEINTQIDQQITNAENEMAAKRGTVEQGYRDIIDSVAVQREIDRRQISETMANLGLSRSGLSATQQTAVQLSAGNKTAAAQRQKQEAIDALTKSLAEYKLEAENTRRETVAGIDAAKEKQLAEYSADIYKSANEAVTKDNETALKAQEQMLKANEAGLKALFDAKSIDALTYSAALSNGYSVQSLYEQGLVKQAGYYKVPDSNSGPSNNEKVLKTLYDSGAIGYDAYAYASDNNLSATQAIEYEHRNAQPEDVVAGENAKPWSWSTTAYRKTGTDTWNDLFNIQKNSDRNIDRNDKVEYYDEKGARQEITLIDLYNNLKSEGMTDSEARAFVTRFNTNDGDKKNTTYFSLSNGDIDAYTTCYSRVAHWMGMGVDEYRTYAIEALEEALNSKTDYNISAQMYNSIRKAFGISLEEIAKYREEKNSLA